MIQVYDLTWLWVLYMMTVGVGILQLAFPSGASAQTLSCSIGWPSGGRAGHEQNKMKNVLLTVAADCCSFLSVASFGLLPTRPCFLRAVADCFLHHFEKCAWMASYSVQFLLCMVRENLLRGNVFTYLILSVLSSENNIPHVTHTLTLTHSLCLSLSLWQSNSQSSQAIAVVLR